MPGGRDDNGKLVGRNDGHTYSTSWQSALDAKKSAVLLDSWNDYERGTELAASRQYAEWYADPRAALDGTTCGTAAGRQHYVAHDIPVAAALAVASAATSDLITPILQRCQPA